MKRTPAVEKFANNLRIIRMGKGIASKELCKLADLRNMKRIFDIEEGRGVADLNEIIAICKVLDQKVDDMLFRDVEIIVTFKDSQ